MSKNCVSAMSTVENIIIKARILFFVLSGMFPISDIFLAAGVSAIMGESGTGEWFVELGMSVGRGFVCMKIEF